MDIEKSFRHAIGLSGDTLDRINIVEQHFVQLAQAMKMLPDSREKSLCYTRLQEAKFWAVESMAKNS